MEETIMQQNGTTEPKIDDTFSENQHSRCIICLCVDSDIENQHESSPLMNIRVLCGGHNIEGLCHCHYNIHTLCFVQSNEVYKNICPMCRQKWWCDSENDNQDTSLNENENENENIQFVKRFIFGYCIIILMCGAFSAIIIS